MPFVTLCVNHAPSRALRIGRGASRTALPRWSVGTIRLC
ncbi:DUF1534 domain-containing protein [Pseudomonas syringae]|nr:DUF1534 domain-containing protein [Pseudomonas syringae]MCF5207979.1 DUF1534 domain-containing protein [Pseudomonas syringae]MCF5213461.1 DUF1534 domain-containing protein [Pseudomonas syringae]MCF5217720.1 DUF1534 domain-containing protein [Pseudomonas syringae]MCF5265303.1 DUF1534 domain-containing protein [Pseudomonas syringae]